MSHQREQLIIIKTPEEAIELIDYLADKELVAYDIEATGTTKRDEIIGFSVCAEADKAYYVILSAWNGTTLEALPNMKEVGAEIIASLKNKKLIMHNGVFDCMMTEAYFKISLIQSLYADTMILAHLLNENRKVGLKELGFEYFGETATDEQRPMKESIAKNGGMITKTNYELYKADAELIARYGAKDAILTYKLFEVLLIDLYEQGLEDFFFNDESMPLLRGPTYDLNTTGLAVDKTALISLKKTLEAECEEIKHFIAKEIEPHIKEKYPATKKTNVFKITSNAQLAWLLFGQLNQEFRVLTDAGKEVCKELGLRLPYSPSAKRQFIELCQSRVGQVYQMGAETSKGKIKPKKFREPWNYIAVDKRTLQTLSAKFKWVEKLLELKKKDKILNTYVLGIEERMQYGIISPSFLQHGTTSGRYASRNPNFQNLPRDDKRVKKLIISRPDKVFVGADQSQLEPRVFAFTSQDKRLMEAFNGTDDFYSVIGMEVYGKTDCIPKKDGSPDAFGIKYKKLRDMSKTIALATTYGATAHQLAPTTGKSIEDTQEDINSYFERFPGVKQMMLDSHEQAKRDGQVVNYFGRPRRMPDAKKIAKIYGKASHADLPYEVRNMLNLSVNHRIQSTGASIMNRAAIALWENLKAANIDAKIVCQVHDSLIVECFQQDAEAVALLLQDAMENTVTLPGIKFEAKPAIGKNLSEV